MKASKQHRMPQEPTVTSKSSGIDYRKNSSGISPSQKEAQPRKKSTRND